MKTRKNNTTHHSSTGVQSIIIASAIFLCRISGFIRQRIFGYFLGISDAADIFNTSFRIPNLLQNLFGEGALSSSFIPAYARLLAEGKEKEARAVAHAVISFLSLVAAIIVCAGIFAAPALVSIIAPGFEGIKRQESINLVRILFPGAGLLALSAWCLGVLNSHGRFFLSYAAPIVWNGAIIAALTLSAGSDPMTIARYAAFGSIIGSALQFIIQLPMVVRLVGKPKFSLSTRLQSVRNVLINFIPSLMTRGVVQVASFVDAAIASLIGSGAVAVISCAQTIYTLPISLFGMSVSAAELPAMSRGVIGPDGYAELVTRLNRALTRIAYFVIPSALALLFIGDTIAAALYQTGKFDYQGVLFVWGALAGASFGLLASTLGRLYSSAFFALHDTRTPLYCAALRVSLGAAGCYFFARYIPALFGIDSQWGTAGITFASGSAAWVEFFFLSRMLNQRVGKTGIPFRLLAALYSSAFFGASIAFAVKLILKNYTSIHPITAGFVVISLYGCIYLLSTYFLKIKESRELTHKIRTAVKRILTR